MNTPPPPEDGIRYGTSQCHEWIYGYLTCTRHPPLDAWTRTPPAHCICDTCTVYPKLKALTRLPPPQTKKHTTHTRPWSNFLVAAYIHRSPLLLSICPSVLFFKVLSPCLYLLCLFQPDSYHRPLSTTTPRIVSSHLKAQQTPSTPSFLTLYILDLSTPHAHFSCSRFYSCPVVSYRISILLFFFSDILFPIQFTCSFVFFFNSSRVPVPVPFRFRFRFRQHRCVLYTLLLFEMKKCVQFCLVFPPLPFVCSLPAASESVGPLGKGLAPPATCQTGERRQGRRTRNYG